MQAVGWRTGRVGVKEMTAELDDATIQVDVEPGCGINRKADSGTTELFGGCLLTNSNLGVD